MRKKTKEVIRRVGYLMAVVAAVCGGIAIATVCLTRKWFVKSWGGCFNRRAGISIKSTIGDISDRRTAEFISICSAISNYLGDNLTNSYDFYKGTSVCCRCAWFLHFVQFISREKEKSNLYLFGVNGKYLYVKT